MNGIGVPLYLLHPMAVHFPIALLVLGLAVAIAVRWSRTPAWLGSAAGWMLGAGTLFLWAALGLGVLAEQTVPHVPPAWRVMAAHEQHAWITAAGFSLLCGLWAWARGRAQGWLLLGWALALSQLVLTAHLGAQLVFTFGLGSAQP